MHGGVAWREPLPPHREDPRPVPEVFQTRRSAVATKGKDQKVNNDQHASEMVGSAAQWPRCGAKTRGKRAGRTCLAAGCSVGGRCWVHGTNLGHSTIEGHTRRLVLLSSGDYGSAIDLAAARPRERRRWQLWGIPDDLFCRLPLEIFERGFDRGEVWERLRAAGVYKPTTWPQALGFRTVKNLLERGRVAYGLFRDTRDIQRATRVHVGQVNLARLAYPLVRVGPVELLEALRAAGTPIDRELRLIERKGPPH